MKRPLKFILFCLYFFCSTAGAASFSETFDSRSRYGSGDLVWNQALGYLHPPLYVDNWSDGVFKDSDYSVGNGSSGSFVNPADYARLSTSGDISGNIIRINTDTNSELHFTSFNLLAGWTMEVTGSEPLKIYSLSTITISGTINCSGEAGGAGSGVSSAIHAGGAGNCGGGAGGNSEAQGMSGGPSVDGGSAGAAGGTTGGQGGGGGGGYSVTTGDAGENPDAGGANDGGALGNRFLDDGFDDEIEGAGSGGGGGSAYTDAFDIANHSSGGAGGGGGGAIHLFAVQDIHITATGLVMANGGAGGDVGGTLRAGGGGGGAGGSILIFAGGDVIVDGQVRSVGGTGGVSGSGANGGTGSDGRTWLVGNLGEPTFGSDILPLSNLANRGVVKYKTGAFSHTTSSIDLGTTRPIPSLISESNDLQGGSVNLLASFGEDLSAASLSSFNPVASYLNAEQKRYMKIRININSSNDATPTKVYDLSASYSVFTNEEYEFVAACGLLKNSNNNFSYLLFLLIPIIICLNLRFSIFRQK